MHNMLIVDNEKIIVDGLKEYFSGLAASELEVYGAYSGREAIALLEKIKFDIVVSDIRMPGMSGLELQQEVAKRWPRCKVLFLTGYDQFDYAHQAIRNGASNYILKTEGYEVIEDAVRKVLEEMNETVRLEHFLSQAQKQLQASLPLMQKEFMQGIVMGDSAVHRSRIRQLEDLRIELLGEHPVMLMIGRVDEWNESVTPSDRALMTYAIQNISEEFLKPAARLYSFSYEPARIVWVLQREQTPDSAADGDLTGRLLHFVRMTVQDIQSSCKTLLKMSVSFAVGGGFADWENVPEQFESLKLLLNFGLGTGKEAILLESRSGKADDDGRETDAPEMPVNLQIRKLHSHLENGEREEFFQRFNGLMETPSFRGPQGKALRLEAVMSLAGMFLSYINSRNLYPQISGAASIEVLAAWNPDLPWNDYAGAVYRIASALFDALSDHQVHQEYDMVTQIQDYVASHLADDLTMTKIGEAFGHHPYYLSRLYKHITDQGLAEYISEVKFNKAKELLRSGDLRIHQVSAAVGFLSEKYFYRFFKKLAGVTPQEFRDAFK